MTAQSLRLQAREIRPQEFEEFRRLIHKTCGIALGDTKDALLTARVARRMRELGLDSHSEYLERIVGDRTGAELQCLVDAVSTNVTSFFREAEHFGLLAARLAKLSAEGATSVRLWSAACSTGEEPYSMAMVAHEAMLSGHGSVRILATDISTKALTTAAAARYSAEKIGKVPHELLGKYMRRQADGSHEVAAHVRSLVALSPINLAKPPFPMKGPFQVIFCRNVMIYFDMETRTRLVAEIERLLAPGGLLMLGHAESLTGIRSTLKPVAAAVYEKAER